MAKKNPEIAKRARDNAEDWRKYFRVNINQYHEMFSFVLGQQWTIEEESVLVNTYNKTPLTFNKLSPIVNVILGEQQQNTPNLQVTPSENVSAEVAEIREALIKEIALNSKSKQVYQQAFTQALVGGFGGIEVATEYESEYSFDQNIILYSCNDPTMWFWDKSAPSVSKTDGMFCGKYSRMNRKKFKKLYGGKIERSIGTVSSMDNNYTWANSDDITIIDYFERTYKNVTMYLMSNGAIIDQNDLDDLLVAEIEGESVYMIDEEMVTIDNERQAKRFTIKWWRVAGDYELDSGEFRSELLPLVFVDQNSYYDKSGQQRCRPFVIDAKDAQRYINYIGTQSAHLLKTTRFDQFLVSKENVRSQDTKAIWKDPASQNGGLFFDKDSSGFVPQQLPPHELPQTMITQYERALNDVYTSTGVYAAKLGQQGNEISGAAIDARTRQGSYNTYVAFNSLNRAIETAGQIVNQLIPNIYDTTRVLRLTLPDTGEENIVINRIMDDYGQVIENDIRKGTYQVRLLPGASFEGQKEITRESLEMILKANPQVFNLIADIFVESLPTENNIVLRNRLKTLVPPEIMEAGRTGRLPPKQEDKPDPQMIMVQLKARELDIKQQELQLKAQKQTQEVQMEIEKLEQERLAIAASIEEQQMRYNAEMHRTLSDEQIAHADNLVKILTHLK